MTSMKNWLKVVFYAVVIVVLIVSLYLNFSNLRAGQSFRAEYEANNKRIEEQQLRYNETHERIMGTVEDIQSGIGEVSRRIEVIETGVTILKGYNRDLADRSVDTEIISDRNDRLLKELERRVAEGTEK
jgi:esterase/lipase